MHVQLHNGISSSNLDYASEKDEPIKSLSFKQSFIEFSSLVDGIQKLRSFTHSSLLSSCHLSTTVPVLDSRSLICAFTLINTLFKSNRLLDGISNTFVSICLALV